MNFGFVNPINKQFNQINQMNNIQNQFGENNLNTMNNLMMNDNNLRIKNIIQPYEEKIKELEEKLRQKEFEIACLKNQIHQNIPSPQNFMFMNNMMMNQMMNSPKYQIDQIIINFKKNEIEKEIKCTYDELMISVINKYVRNYFMDIDDYKFIFNGKEVNNNLTVGESGISNNSIINVVKIKNLSNNFDKDDLNSKVREDSILKNLKYNIRFNCNWGLKLNIVCNNNETVGIAIKRYLKRIGLNENNFNDFFFIYNSRKIEIEDKNKILNKYFFPSYVSYHTIVVQNVHNVIGN